MEPVKIVDSKLVYPEFKYFKNIYTQINIANEVYLTGEDDFVSLYFSKDSEYYLLSGKITADSEFSKWLKQYKRTVKTSIQNLILIGKTLKKNAEAILYTEEYFKFIIHNSETEESTEIIFKNVSQPEKLVSQIKTFSEKFTTIETLNEEYFSDDICAIYLNEKGELTPERTSIKLIEIPTARIKSIIKDSVKKLMFSEIQENGQRFVAIQTNNSELQLELTQFFITI